MPIENNVDMQRRPAISVQVGGALQGHGDTTIREYIHRNNIDSRKVSAIKFTARRWKARVASKTKKVPPFHRLVDCAQQ